MKPLTANRKLALQALANETDPKRRALMEKALGGEVDKDFIVEQQNRYGGVNTVEGEGLVLSAGKINGQLEKIRKKEDHSTVSWYRTCEQLGLPVIGKNIVITPRDVDKPYGTPNIDTKLPK